MTTIYTTDRFLTVKESYKMIADCLQRDEQKVIELTEVISIYGEWTDKADRKEKRILLNKQHIIEVVAVCDKNENKAKDEKKIDVKTAIGYLEHWKHLSTNGMGKKIMIDEAYVEVLEMAIAALRCSESGGVGGCNEKG